MRKSRWIWAVLALLLVFWGFVGWSIPYGPVDDFRWGMEDGLHWWLGGMLNGRYAGNMFAVIMCRFPAVKVLVMGLSMFLIPTLAARIAVRGQEKCFLPALLLCHGGVLLMPAFMWREVYGWVSGFGNYGVSVLFFLLWLLALHGAEQNRRNPWAWAALLFPLTLVLGMFVESLTLLVFGASLILALYALRARELRTPFFACLLGALLALVPMFCNEIVAQLISSGVALNGHRTLTFDPEDGLLAAGKDILLWYTGKLLPIPFLRGVHFSIPLALITACAFWNGPLRPLAALAVLPLGYNGYVMYTENYGGTAGTALCVLCWLLPALAIAIEREPLSRRGSQLLIYAAAPLYVLPYAATVTLGHRLFFFPLVMILLTAARQSAPLFRRRGVLWLACAVLTAGMALWGSRCWEVLACTCLRERLIQEAVETGADTLILPNDTQENKTVYIRNPGDAAFAYYFREFYHLSQDVTLVILPAGSFQLWPDIPPGMWDRRLELPPSDDFVTTLP